MQSDKNKQITWLIKFLKKGGFRVMVVPIHWRNRVMSEYVEEFKKFYDVHKTESNYILGFSYGAVIAFITANQLKPKKIYLCSLSPEFKEDAIKMKPWVRKLIGKRRFQDAKKRSGKAIAKELKVPSVILYGEAEGRKFPQLKILCEETAKLATKSKLVIVRDATHNLDHPEYIKSLKKELCI